MRFAILLLLILPAASFAQEFKTSSKFHEVGDRLESLQDERLRAKCKSIPEWFSSVEKGRAKETRSAAARALMRASQHRELLEAEKLDLCAAAAAMVNSEDEHVRVFAAHIITNVGDSSCVAAINKLLTDNDIGIKKVACRAAERHGDKTTVAVLKAGIDKKPVYEISTMLIRTIGAIGGKEAKAVLEETWRSVPDRRGLDRAAAGPGRG